MKDINILLDRTNIVPAVLAFISALFFTLMLVGVKIPFIENYRDALIALCILGVLMAVASFKRSDSEEITEKTYTFITITGIIGIFAAAMLGARLFNLELPLIPGDKEAFIALGIMILAGWLVTIVHHLVSIDELYYHT